MKDFRYILYSIGLALFTSCADDITTPSVGESDDVVGTPVLLSAGNENMQGVQGSTRAATTTFMPNKVRFSAAMYYQESVGVYNLTPWQAYLQVDDANAGNCNYRQVSFAAPAVNNVDNYDNDLAANIFYWQNRQNHIFIGYIDNYNAAYASAKAESQTYIPDNLVEHDDFSIMDNQELVRNQMCKHFDLRNPKDKKPDELKEDETAWTSMSDQYDPLIACTEKHPAGAGGETNRVYLTFKHQFSQIQVNLKGHESVNLEASQIDAVELLGVSESADVFPFVDYLDSSVGPETPESPGVPETPETPEDPELPNTPESGIVLYEGSYIRPAEAGRVDLTQYTDEQMEANPYGTSFNTFLASEVSTGYLKRFEAIAYGQLQALRIHWHENSAKKDIDGHEIQDSEGKPVYIEHVVTFVIPEQNFRELKSGKRYVFNLEIRRGTLAVVRAEIDDWVPYETVYYEEGTIQN